MQCHRSSKMAEKHHEEGDSNREYHPNSSVMFSDNFPEGLRVLVFDKDKKYLLELEKHLREFQYEVTCCNDEEKAMYLLRNHRSRFDIAIIEVHKTDSDRLRLLSKIRSEIDIIIMSKDESLESVINWMSHGACDYLIKPLNPVDLRFIFKHAAKKIRGKMSVVAGNIQEKAAGDRSFSVDSTIKNLNKRKISIFPDEQANEDDHDLDRDHASTSKKKRVVWDEQLHKKFVDAVEYLGTDKAVPTKILEIMNVEHIGRANVASHLQKYRQNKTKKEEIKQPLLTPQEGRMYVGNEVQDFYNGRNVQFPTHHINNIPQPSVQQHIMKPNNLRTHLMSPLRHHHDGVSIAVSDRNLVMTDQHHLHHQVSNFNAEESLGYNNFNEDEPTNWASFFTSNSEEVSLFHFQNPVMAPATPNDDHLSPSSILHSFPSSSHIHSAFLNQQENGGFNYKNGYSVNNNRLI